MIVAARAEDAWRQVMERRGSWPPGAREAVKKIVEDVRRRGVEALREWSLKLDGIEPRVLGRGELREAWLSLSREQRSVVEALVNAVRGFHEAQLPRTVEWRNGGLTVRLVWIPVSPVGVYAPSGGHPYFSTVAMCAVPAKVAGARRVVAASPVRPGAEKLLLGAAYASGVDELLVAGGAQAVAALAFGVGVEPVSKIVGPGSPYVQLAKLEVAERVGFDMVAGPTELAVVADGSLSPKAVALDMLAQAEHGSASLVVLLSASRDYAMDVRREFEKMYRPGFADAYFLWADSVEECMRLANELAPEHLLLAVSNPEELVGMVENAGAVSLAAPPAAMDYCAGSNHVLPTGGWSRHRGALTVYDFLKAVPVVSGFDERLLRASAAAAGLEGFKMHRDSLLFRLNRG